MEEVNKFRGISNANKHILAALRFPVAMHPSHETGKTKSWTSILAEEDFEEDELKKDEKNTAILNVASGFEFDSMLYQILTLPSNFCWQILVLLCIIVNFFVTTTYYFFNPEKVYSVYIQLYVLDLIYLADITLALVHRYWKPIRFILKLERRSLLTLCVDCFSLIPIGMLYHVSLGSGADINVMYFMRIITFLRLYRLSSFFSAQEDTVGTNHWILFVIKYILYFLLCHHSFVCIWYSLGCIRDCKNVSWTVVLETSSLPQETTWDWYFISAYYILSTMSNVGFGDLTSTNEPEQILSILAMLTGFCLTIGTLIGSLTSEIVKKEQRQVIFSELLWSVKKYLQNINLDPKKTNNIIQYYEVLWTRKNGVKQAESFNLLPLPLQMEVCFDINIVLCGSSLLFRDLGEPFLRNLSLRMKNEFHLPGDIIFHQNVAKACMICVMSGVIEILSDEDNESPMISFTDGTCLGEIAMVMTCPAKATVRAATYTELQVLYKSDFLRMMADYPSTLDWIRKEIYKRINNSHNNKVLHDKNTVVLSLTTTETGDFRPIKFLKDKLREVAVWEKTHTEDEDEEIQIQKTTIGESKFSEDFLDLYNIAENVTQRENTLCMGCGFPWIMRPDTTLVKTWRKFILCLVIIVGFCYPYYIGFKQQFPLWLTNVSLVVDCFYILDIYIQCTTAIEVKDGYIIKAKEILYKRMDKLGFYFDVFACFPVQVIAYLMPSTNRDRMSAVLMMNRLLKSWRIPEYFECLERDLWTNLFLLRIIKYILYLLLISYWAGVILYLEACIIDVCNENSWYEIKKDNEIQAQDVTPTFIYPYTMATYFAMMALSGVGYGDIVPENETDILFVSVYMIIGSLLFGYCIAQFSATIIHFGRTRANYQEIIFGVKKYMKENNLNRDIINRVYSYFCTQWDYNRGLDIRRNRDLLSDTTSKNQEDALNAGCVQLICSVPLFEDADMGFVQFIAKGSIVSVLPPNEIITYSGGVSREMYIIQEGSCEVLCGKTGRIESIEGPRSHFGSLEMLYGIPSVLTVRTITNCKVISITYSTYSQGISMFPGVAYEMEEIIQDPEFKEGITKFDYKHRFCPKQKTLPKKKIFDSKQCKHNVSEFFNLSFVNTYKKCRNSGGLEDYWAPFNKIGKYRFIKFLLLPWIIIPTGNFIKMWCFCRILAAIFVGIIGPLQQTITPMGPGLATFLQCMDVFAYIDLYLLFHVGYFNEKGVLVTHPMYTAAHYLKSGFVLDLFACFPFEILLPLFSPEHGDGNDALHSRWEHERDVHFRNCLVHLNRVFQVHRLPAAFLYMESHIFHKTDVIRVVKYLPFTLVIINMWASLLINFNCYFTYNATLINTSFEQTSERDLTDVIRSKGQMKCSEGSWLESSHFKNITDPISIYLVSYYWVTSTMVSVGFGDLSGQDSKEMMICIVMVIMGILLFGSKAGFNNALSQYQEMMRELVNFMEHEAVHLQLQKRFTDHFEYQFKRSHGIQSHNVFDKFHTALMEDAVLCLYENTLREVPLFENVERSFFRVIGKHLKEVYFLRGEEIIRSYDVQSNIYIIYRGKVEVLSSYNEMIACMGPGGLFGNIRGVSASICHVSIVASRNLDVLSISSETFYNILKNYPNVKRKMNAVLAQAEDFIMPTTIADDEDSIQLDNVYGPGDEELGLHQQSSIVTTETTSHYSVRTRVSTITTETGATAASIYSCNMKMLLPQYWFRVAILPTSHVYTLLDNIILVVSYFNCLLITYHFAFQDNSYTILIISETLEIVFYVNIFFKLQRAYVDKYGDYVTDVRKIRYRYIKNREGFIIDIVANFPFDIFVLIVPYGQRTKYLSIIRLVHLLRIYYIFEYYQSRSMLLMGNMVYLKTSIIIIWSTLLAHTFACIWFMTACPLAVCEPYSWADYSGISEKKPFQSYIVSLYYLVTVFTTTGYGDILSHNTNEIVIAIIIMIIFKFSIGMFIGDITAVLDSVTSTLTHYEHGIIELRDSLTNQNLSNHQMEKMWNYVRQLWKRERGMQTPRFVLRAPFVLQTDLMNAVYGHHLRNSYVFANTNEDFLRQLTVKLKHCVFFPGNYIVQHGDTDMNMYFIHRGEVAVLTVHPNLTETVHDILKTQDMFGLAQGLYHGLPHHFSFRARSTVDIVSLNLDTWYYMLKYFPETGDEIYRRASLVYVNV